MERDENSFLRRAAPPILLAALGVILTAGLWRPLLLYGHSSLMDARRLLVFNAAFQGGGIFPRWVPQFYFGYGSPIFHFYAPLPYFLSELFVRAGFNVAGALKGTLVLTWALSGVFMYLLARDYLSRPASFAAGFFYMLAPYHLLDMLVRHAFGEHVAFAWIPLAVWGVAGSVRRPSASRFFGGAVGTALLLLTHNITAMIFAPVLAFWWLYETLDQKKPRAGALGAGSAILGLALSAFFWLPAFVEKNLVFARESLTEEFFRYEQHFVYLRQLLFSAWGFGGSRAGIEEDAMSFQIGIAHWIGAVAAAAGLIVALRRKEGKAKDDISRGTVVAFHVFFVGMFMATGASRVVWSAVPTLSFVQFPWRFLVIAAFGASLLAGSAVDFLTGNREELRIRSAAAACACALLFYGAYLRPWFEIAVVGTDDREAGPFSVEEKNLRTSDRYFDPMKTLTLDAVMNAGETGTSRDDYLPRSVLEKPFVQRDSWATAENGEVMRVDIVGPNAYAIDTDMREEGRLTFNQFDFPGWRVTIDRQGALAQPSEMKGLISVIVPAGRHQVKVFFDSTPLRRGATIVSWAALALLVMVALALKIRSKDK